MMNMIRETTPDAQARFEHKGRRSIYRSDAELAMRQAAEDWGRKRWPNARCVHELVMDRGTVRADVAFIDEAHIAVIEIKSEYDDTSRLLNQCGMFRLAVPELWIAAPNRHIKDAELVRYLMPSIGIIIADRGRSFEPLPEGFCYEEHVAAKPFTPWAEATLSLLWVAELAEEAARARVYTAKKATHAKLISAMLQLSWDEQIRAVCRQLRARTFGWRADPEIPTEPTRMAA